MTRLLLLLQAQFLDNSAVCTLVVRLKILQMLSTVGYETQKSAARVLILIILGEVVRKLLDTASQKRDLHLWRACIGIVALRLCNFIQFLSLRKHCEMVAQYNAFRKLPVVPWTLL